jgi:pyruvate ferredoxin oxidoreductase alpha subunit
MDKVDGFNAAGGPLFNEIVCAMYGKADGKIVQNYIYGLGGRDITTYQIEAIYNNLFNAIETGKYEVYNYIGVRE